MGTPNWIKKLGGHAGELFVSAELSKRAIPNVLLPENFPDSDILFSDKDGRTSGYIQVKSCHPDRSKSFILKDKNELWTDSRDNHFVAFVWLGRPLENENPKYWIASKKEVGKACKSHQAHGSSNWERRFYCKDFDKKWENNWKLIEEFVTNKK